MNKLVFHFGSRNLRYMQQKQNISIRSFAKVLPYILIRNFRQRFREKSNVMFQLSQDSILTFKAGA